MNLEIGPVDQLEHYLQNLEDANSYSEIDTFQRCRRKAKYGYQLRLGDPAPHIAADAGTVIHAGLATLRRSDGNLDEAVEKLRATYNKLFAWVPTMGPDYGIARQYHLDHLISVIQQYALKIYRFDKLHVPSKDYVEIAFVVTIPAPAHMSGPPAVLYGRIDWIGVHEVTKKISPLDIKTTKSWGQDFEGRFDPGLQGDMYTYVCQQIFTSEVIQGFYIDGILLQVTEKDPANWFNRLFINKSPLDMAEFVNETYWWVQQYRQAKAEQWWPKSTNQCSAYGGCAFRSICTGHENINTIGQFPQRPAKGFHFGEDD